MKKICFVLALVFFTVGTVGCSSAAGDAKPDINDKSIEYVIDTTMPEPFSARMVESGGDELGVYSAKCSKKISGISGEFLELVDSEKLSAWVQELEARSYSEMVTDINNCVCLPSFIKHFDVPYETVKNILLDLNIHYNAYGRDELTLTDEEIEALCARKDPSEIPSFYSEFAVAVNGQSYSPEFVYSHTPETLKAVGITAEDLLSRIELYEKIPFLPEAITAFENKIVNYAIESISLGELNAPFELPKFATVEIPDSIKNFSGKITDFFNITVDTSEVIDNKTPVVETTAENEAAAAISLPENEAQGVETSEEMETTVTELHPVSEALVDATSPVGNVTIH